jgi:hypothetical protein
VFLKFVKIVEAVLIKVSAKELVALLTMNVHPILATWALVRVATTLLHLVLLYSVMERLVLQIMTAYQALVFKVHVDYATLYQCVMDKHVLLMLTVLLERVSTKCV